MPGSGFAVAWAVIFYPPIFYRGLPDVLGTGNTVKDLG
jgi:hypothetical protein